MAISKPLHQNRVPQSQVSHQKDGYWLIINHDFPNNGNLFNDFLFNHQQDEQLAMSYIAALPFSRPLVYWDGQVLKSTTEIKNYDGSTRVGGEA